MDVTLSSDKELSVSRVTAPKPDLRMAERLAFSGPWRACRREAPKSKRDRVRWNGMLGPGRFLGALFGLGLLSGAMVLWSWWAKADLLGCLRQGGKCWRAYEGPCSATPG